MAAKYYKKIFPLYVVSLDASAMRHFRPAVARLHHHPNQAVTAHAISAIVAINPIATN